MRRATALLLAGALLTPVAGHAAWQAEIIPTQGAVESIETIDGEVRVATARGWFVAEVGADGEVTLTPAEPPRYPPIPQNALPDGVIAGGTHDIARAWLAVPTPRYEHGVLGDAIEAGAMVIETRDGKRHSVTLGDDAVFEDLEPRIADLDGDGHDEIIVVKSYLARGAALAVIGARGDGYAVIAETPPIGRSHRWLNPAGIADFDGDGFTEIALVRMPHALGRLELWQWQDGALRKVAEMNDTSNHAIGTRVLRMSAVADIDGDGVSDLALPSFNRRSVRVLSFVDGPREIARVALPAKAVTAFGLLQAGDTAAVLAGLEDGRLVSVRP